MIWIIASRSSSSPHTTITPFDVKSFTTDHFQQSWPPTPLPTQPSAPSLNNNNSNNSVLEDFVLYPQPSSQPRRRVSRPLAHPSIALKPSALQPFLAQNNPRRHSFSLQLHRHLQQQFSGSPVQDPRVTQLARSPSYWSQPVKHSRSQSTAVPTNSPHRPSNRSFHVGNQNEKRKQYMHQYRSNMSSPNYQGKHLLHVPHRYPSISYSSSHLSHAHIAHAQPSEQDLLLFDLPSTGIMDANSWDAVLGSDASPEAPAGTISPKDLMMANSMPPSATFTDMSTPALDSPGDFSDHPSPLFDDFSGPPESWGSLFGGHANDPSDFTNYGGPESYMAASSLPMFSPVETKKEIQSFDLSRAGVALSMAPPALPDVTCLKAHPSIEMSPPPKPAPKASPISATGSSKPSAVAGISRQRKELSPLDFDPSDPAAAKRARNTEAARKSRAKKQQRQADAESRIADLEDALRQRDEEVARLQAKVQALEDAMSQ
ncbi:Cross-pathway control protein A [Penicillium malachiteum]|uniref:Cross-pathway control protein A n=1 Tax=Penicillium malachiteum TaxID=1324776 RepID=UPI0025486F44|nr:Cross-pathway control protein A [Penicillium malachiteum]KAJ5730033.1 Cross-pathway control protein A [Penicillium malachiteum]